MRVTDYEWVGENEHQLEVSFQGAFDGTNNAGEIRCGYDEAKLVRL